MSIITWIVLGLIAGFISSKIVNHHGSGVLLDVLIGVVGAFVGGLIFSVFGLHGITGFNIWSLLVAVGGAILVLALYHGLMSRRAHTV